MARRVELKRNLQKRTNYVHNYCFASVVSSSTEINGKTASSILSPQSAVSPKMEGQLMHHSPLDKHGGIV
jgi:hypothetical protein